MTNDNQNMDERNQMTAPIEEIVNAWMLKEKAAPDARDPVGLLEDAWDSLPENEKPDKFMPLKRAFMKLVKSNTERPLREGV